MMTATTTAALLSDGEAPPKSPENKDDTHKPVGDQPEIQSGEALVVEAYAVIWIIILGFVIVAWMRTRALAGRVDVLERALAKAREAAPPQPAASAARARPAKKAAGKAASGEAAAEAAEGEE